MATKAQDWARKRSWEKARLTQTIARLNLARCKGILTPYEAHRYAVIVGHIQDILNAWELKNQESKYRYMNERSTE
jgi:hypothetical protein